MKRLKLFFACLLMAVLSIGQVWGAAITVNANPTTSGTFTISAAQGSGQNAPIVAGTGTQFVRLYANNTLTISTSGSANITAMTIAWTKNSNKSFATVSTTTGSYTHPSAAGNGTWTGSAKEIVFTVGASGQIQITSVDITVEEGGKTLSSIAVGGNPTTDTYDEGDAFDPAGLTVTGTYSDASQETISSGITWTACKTENGTYVALDDAAVALAKEETGIYVKATANEITSAAFHVTGLTVNEHTVTPGTYDIIFANAFWGTSGTGQNAGHTASGNQNDISVSINGNSGTQNYINDNQTRIYGSHTLTFSVPSGYVLKQITGLGTTSYSSISVASGSTGTISNRVWTGSANSVTFDLGGRTDFTTVSVTYAVYEAPTACATPTFSPADGEYEEAQNVTISCATEGATIYYTIDGTNPKESVTKSEYIGAISVTEAKTIKAYATKTGLLDSEVAEAEYTFVAGPEVTLDFTTNDEWEFPTEKTVDANEYTAGGYTITVAGTTGKGYNFDTDHLFLGQNGAYITLPTFDFPVSKVVCVGVESGSGSVTFNLFEGSTPVSTAVTSCKVDQTFEIDEENQASNKTYTIKLTNANNARFAKIKVYRGVEPAVVKPVISGEENFVTSAEVTITCETTGATIYYTTNGDDPKVSGITSPNPFTLTDAATVKAAAKLGDDWSAIAEKSFTKISALTTMEQVQAAMPAEGTEHINIVIEDWIVTANKSGQSQVWIANADNTKGILLYQSGHGFAAGNKLNGVVLNVGITKYNTAPQLMSFTSEDVTVTTASDITPNETTIDAITTAIQGTVIKLTDLTYSSANSNFSDGEQNKIAIDTRLYTPALVDGATYDLTGVVMFANGGAVKLIPRSETDVVKTSADPLPEVNNLAGLKAAEKGSYVVNLVDAVVTLVDGNNAFIEDATAGALIYKSGHGFSAGDKLNGQYEVTTSTFQGKFEITAITAQAGATTTPDAEIPVTTLTIAQLNADFAANESKRIKIVGVNVTDAVESGDATARTGEISDGENTITLYAGKSGVTAAENANIDVIGYPTFHNTDQQLAVWAQADITVNEKEDAELSWTRESDVITEAQVASWTAPTLNNPHSVTITSYETSNDEVATVSDGVIALEGGLGTANITAHFAGDQTYEAADVVYTITVNEYVPENTDIITAEGIGVEGNSYMAWTGKTGFGTSSVYAGNSTNATNPNAGALQLRYNTASDKQSGIVLTESNGMVLKGLSVSVKTGSNTLNVYAKATAYSGYADLYSDDEDVRGKLIGTVSATGAMTLEEGVSYDDNYQYIGMRSANGALYLNDITITWGEPVVPPTPSYTEVRNGLTEGWYYTMCLDKAVTAVKAGSIWRVLSKAANGTDVILEEVTGTLDAGRPYIFRAAASTLEVAYTGDAVLAPITTGNNGLIGSFSQTEIAQSPNNFIIYNNELYYVNSEKVYVGANRAYLDMTGVPAYSNEPQQGNAPRRRVVMTVHGEQTATGCENINASETPVKMIIDGQLYILRGEKMYDATGKLVK